MIYRIIQLRSRLYDDIKTEVMYEVASAHAAGCELIRLNITKDEELGYHKRAMTSLIKCLKTMKGSGMIQFFATLDSFEQGNTEAQFLINKYPDIFEALPKESDTECFVYVRV